MTDDERKPLIPPQPANQPQVYIDRGHDGAADTERPPADRMSAEMPELSFAAEIRGLLVQNLAATQQAIGELRAVRRLVKDVADGVQVLQLASHNGNGLDGISVLLVEDNKEVREATEKALRLGGAQVYSVPGTTEALEFARQRAEDIDVAYIDHALELSTGESLAMELEGRWPHIGIVITSGYGQPNWNNRAYQFVPKPSGGYRAIRDAIRAALKTEHHPI